MTIARHQAWDDTEIAAVTVADLTAAIGLWLARERAGIVLVDEESFATTEQIEARIRWDVLPKSFEIELGCATLLEGSFQDRASGGQGEDASYGYLQTTFRF